MTRLLNYVQTSVAAALGGFQERVMRELWTIAEHIENAVRESTEVLERNERRTVTVVLLGNFANFPGTVGEYYIPCCLSWSGELAADEKRTVRMRSYRTIRAGAYLVCLDGFLSDVRIGDRCIGALMSEVDGGGLGPFVQLEAPFEVGSALHFQVQLSVESGIPLSQRGNS